MSNYIKKYTLLDLFNSKALQNYIPTLKVSQKGYKAGKMRKEKTINHYSYDLIGAITNIAISASENCYEKYNPMVSANIMRISGKLKKHIGVGGVQNKVYNRLVQNKESLAMLVTYNDLITDALNYSEALKARTRKAPKLYLTINDLSELKHFSPQKMENFFKSVVDNLYYSDDFASINAEFKGKDFWLRSSSKAIGRYEWLQRDWKRKVGANK